MSFYVKRSLDDRVSWTGPIRSERQAEREAAAWQDAGWSAEVVPSSPEIRADVKVWVARRERERASR